MHKASLCPVNAFRGSDLGESKLCVDHSVRCFQNQGRIDGVADEGHPGGIFRIKVRNNHASSFFPVGLESHLKSDLLPRLKNIGSTSKYVCPDHIAAVHSLVGQGLRLLAELRDIKHQRTGGDIPYAVDLAEHRMDLAWKHRCPDFGDRLRIVSSGSSDIRLADTIFTDH